jgi:hypothetical protein
MAADITGEIFLAAGGFVGQFDRATPRDTRLPRPQRQPALVTCATPPVGHTREVAAMLNISDDNRIRTLTLNRPEALNAFSEALYDATTRALLAAA